MNLIEILNTLQGLSRAEMWQLLEEKGVNYTLQEAIMQCVNERGEFINTDGIEYQLLQVPKIKAVKRQVPLNRIVGSANCGCHYHAEDGIPCKHDLALLHAEKKQVPTDQIIHSKK